MTIASLKMKILDVSNEVTTIENRLHKRGNDDGDTKLSEQHPSDLEVAKGDSIIAPTNLDMRSNGISKDGLTIDDSGVSGSNNVTASSTRSGGEIEEDEVIGGEIQKEEEKEESIEEEEEEPLNPDDEWRGDSDPGYMMVFMEEGDFFDFLGSCPPVIVLEDEDEMEEIPSHQPFSSSSSSSDNNNQPDETKVVDNITDDINEVDSLEEEDGGGVEGSDGGEGWEEDLQLVEEALGESFR